MTTFENIVNNLPSDPNKKGLEFEKICKWYLLNSPFYKKQIKNVWLWNEWKDRWSNQDRGIDLIAETKSGEIWAVQAKAYDSKNQIPKSDIDSFLSESSRSSINFRLLIATTDKLSAGAKQAIEGQQIPVGLRMLNDLINEELDWNITKKEVTPVIKTPRPHQKSAIKDTITEFKSNNKGQLIMACGTGKTLTGLWIKESLNADTTLVLLPSISLLSQTLREWLINSKTEFAPFAICSDESVGNNEEVYKTYELGIPVTTDKTKIKKFLTSKGKKVVFSTYQSSQRIAEAIGRMNFKFDLIISDEAHRTTGVSSKEFSLILDDKLIPFQHKLFTTATPKILTNSVKSTADERGLVVNSMDNIEIYGPIFHKLDFSEAIDKDLLTDYKVVVVGVDKEEYKKLITKREIVNYEDVATTDAHTLATLIAVLKGIKKYKLKKLITFHSRVKGAKDFSSLIADLVSNLTNANKLGFGFESDFVSGAMPSFERDLKLRNLKMNKNITLLSNARCLSEGVDVPSLDAVVFADPRRSQVDIVQAIGRAIRKSENKKRGILLLPVVIDEDKELEEQLDDSGFKTVWNVINALKSHDSRIEEQLDNFRLRKGRRKVSKSSSFIDNVEFDLPLKINKDFEENIKLRILNAVSTSWYEFFGVYQDFIKETGNVYLKVGEDFNGYNLGDWLGYQRTLHNKNKLEQEKVDLLENTKAWTWDPDWDEFNKAFQVYKNFCKRNNTFYVKRSEVYKGIDLGKRVAFWRSNYSKNKNSRYYKALSDFGFLFDVREERWWNRYEQLLVNYDSDSLTQSDKNWLKDQRSGGRTGRDQKLNQDQLKAIEKFKDIKFDSRKEINLRTINNHIEVFKEYRTKHKHLSPFINETFHSKKLQRTFSIGAILQDYRKSKDIPKKVKVYLNSLPKSEFLWNYTPHPLEGRVKTTTLRNFLLILEKYEVSTSNKEIKRIISTFKHRYRYEIIDPFIKKELENLPGWKWNDHDELWNLRFDQLKNYLLKNDILSLNNSTRFDNAPIGKWASNQINLYKKGSLPNEKIKLLENLDNWLWEVDKRNIFWEQYYKEVKKYSIEHKNSLIPEKYISNNLEVGKWVSRQRKFYKEKRNSLNKERIKKLEVLQYWEWESDKKNIVWESKFEVLKQYLESGGDLNQKIPEDFMGVNLDNWVRIQWTSKKEGWGSLTKNRIKKLEELDNWQWQKISDFEKWKMIYDEVFEIAKDKNSFPTIGKELSKYQGEWFKRQRTLHRRNKLSKEKIDLLENINNWDWDPQKTEWINKYNAYLIYIKENQTLQIGKYKYFNNLNLGYWVHNVRTSYKSKKLSKEKIELMESIPGWSWKVYN
jgi:superfamily II DNA or RNA helicase